MLKHRNEVVRLGNKEFMTWRHLLMILDLKFDKYTWNQS